MANVEVVEYSPNMKNRWDTFVIHESNNGTVFHTMTFLSYHGDKFKENERHLMFYKGHDRQNLLGVIPLCVFKENGTITARSPYGASYGGLVSRPLIPLRYYTSMLDEFIKYISKYYNVEYIYISPPPYIYSKIYDCYFEFIMYAKGFELYDRRITSVVDLSTFCNDPFEIIKSNEKRAIRKAIRSGVYIKENINNNEEIRHFYNILVDNMKRHGTKPTHTLNELLTLKKLLPKNIKIDLAYYDGEPIAGVMYIVCNSRVALTFYICHHKDFSKLNAVSFLIYHGLKWAKKNGLKFLDLGGTVSKENYENNSVIFFKENFGAVGVFRDHYRLLLN